MELSQIKHALVLNEKQNCLFGQHVLEHMNVKQSMNCTAHATQITKLVQKTGLGP